MFGKSRGVGVFASDVIFVSSNPVFQVVFCFSYVCRVAVRGDARNMVNKIGMMGERGWVFEVGIEAAELLVGGKS